jgi:thioredoxin-related protein
MRSALRAFLLLALICSPIVSSRVVVEAEGCIYCKLFRRDVLPTYESSEQARDMPVHFVDINDIDANHLDFKTDVDIVPTFVVVKSRHEIGRISGYIGPENFFHSISYLLAASP